jgi:hypothetical protein
VDIQELNAYAVKKQTIKSDYNNLNQCLKQEIKVIKTYTEIYYIILVKLQYNWISYMAMLSDIYSLSYLSLSNLRHAEILNPLEESKREIIFVLKNSCN